MSVSHILVAALLRGGLLPFSSVFATLLIIVFIPIQNGESLISNKEQNIELDQINTDTSSNLSTK
ncbi:MAG: hypothetical protein WBZ50_04130 [Nitrososphaeraceae archaeon]